MSGYPAKLLIYYQSF